MLTKEQIEKIETLNNIQNNGKGIRSVVYIVNWLKNNDISMAQKLFNENGDIIINYPELYVLIVDTIGCKIHGKENCMDGLCKEIYNEISRQMALNSLDKKEFKDEK
jgi:hypothetical protein